MRLTRREQRTVFAGAVLVVLIGATWAIRSSGLGFAATGSEAGEAAEALYARYSALAAAAETVRRALEHARVGDTALRRELLGEADPALAGAAVLELVQGAAARSRLKLERALLDAPDSVAGSLGRIAVEALLVGDVYGLRQFVYEIASESQTLTLDQLRIDGVAGPTGAPFSRSRAPLQIQARVSGYAPLDGREEAR